MESLVLEIKSVIDKKLPKHFVNVHIFAGAFGGKYIGVNIASSNHKINGVSLQYPEHISFWVTENLELEFVHFGGCGGQSVYRKIDKNLMDEKYLALGREKIKFRKPKQTKEAVLKSIESICDRYLEVVRDIYKRGLICNPELLDYENLLS